MDIGKKIRELRKERGLTIKEVAERAGCTASFLSQLERGKTEPSIAMLKKIADVLNVNIVDFFMDGINDDNIVTRPDERVLITLKRWDAEIYSLVKTLGGKKMQPFYTIIKPKGGSEGMYQHEGEEFGFVLEGEIDLILNGKTIKVKKGECFYFSSRIPHCWKNNSKSTAVVLWVITPPTF